MSFLLCTLFFLTALLLILVILLQEGKGGGLTDAFGGAGAATFGVRSGGINRFTFGLFAVFVLSAMALHWTVGDPNAGSVLSGMEGIDGPTNGAPVNPDGTPPANSGGQPDNG